MNESPLSRARARSRATRRRGIDDLPILIALAHFRAATVRTMCYRFFVHAGRDPRHGLRTIRRLVMEGMIDSSSLVPQLGAASQRVLTLTTTGWSELDLLVPRRDAFLAAHDHAWRRYWCQRAHVLTSRAIEGWTWCRSPETFERLRAAALLRLRGHALTELEREFQVRIRRAPAQSLRLECLVHSTGAARLMVPVHEGRNPRAALAKLPALSLLAPIEMELVCAQPNDVSTARRDINRWWKSREPAPVVHALPSFASLPNPAPLPATTIDRYAVALGKDVRALLKR